LNLTLILKVYPYFQTDLVVTLTTLKSNLLSLKGLCRLCNRKRHHLKQVKKEVYQVRPPIKCYKHLTLNRRTNSQQH
jgi:hypothetical protein